MAIVLYKFTLTLRNTCLVETYANIYFRLNNGRNIDVSDFITAESDKAFEYIYNIDTTKTNILYVTGDYIGSFELVI